MADLSAYIDFSVVLDKASQTIKFIDPNAYPAGIAVGLTGIFSITEPDGITLTGNFGSPDVFFSGGGLTQPTKVLRLDNNNSFQNGGYTIVYTVRHAGYTDTVLTKTFTLFYTVPTIVITNSFNIFTPVLSVSDATTYTQTGMTISSIVESWSVSIISVSGITQTITGTGSVMDLAYLGSYYDSQYNVTLTTSPSYVLSAPAGWVTLIDFLQKSVTLFAQIPPDITTLDLDMLALKNELDAAVSNCNTYDILLARYILASSLYSDFRRLGCDGQVTTLITYLFQLLKIFNNNVNPVYVNTNAVIPPYDFQCGGGGSTAWAAITGKPSTITIEFVASGSQSTYVDARLLNIPTAQVIVVRNGLPQFSSNPGDGDSYFTKVITDNFITFQPALSVSEKVIIIILPL